MAEENGGTTVASRVARRIISRILVSIRRDSLSPPLVDCKGLGKLTRLFQTVALSHPLKGFPSSFFFLSCRRSVAVLFLVACALTSREPFDLKLT